MNRSALDISREFLLLAQALRDQNSEQKEENVGHKIVDHTLEFYEGVILALTDDMTEADYENPRMEKYFNECFEPLARQLGEKMRRFTELANKETNAPLPVRKMSSYTNKELRALGYHVSSII